MLDPLELEAQVVVRCPVWVLQLNLDPLQAQQASSPALLLCALSGHSF